MRQSGTSPIIITMTIITRGEPKKLFIFEDPSLLKASL
jgi:hypothetical protein